MMKTLANDCQKSLTSQFRAVNSQNATAGRAPRRTRRGPPDDGPLLIQALGAVRYGRWPMAPSRVRVSPLMNLKSGLASCTTTRPISFSTSP